MRRSSGLLGFTDDRGFDRTAREAAPLVRIWPLDARWRVDELRPGQVGLRVVKQGQEAKGHEGQEEGEAANTGRTLFAEDDSP